MMSPDSTLRSPRMAVCATTVFEASGGGDAASHSSGTQRWLELVKKVDAAVASGEASAMLRAWQAASVAALLDSDWSSMMAVGDAAVRIGRVTGLRFAFGAKARQSYQVALYRAHRTGAVDGVLAAAEGFAELGDIETVDQCLVIATRLLENQPRRDVAHKIDVMRARLSGPR